MEKRMPDQKIRPVDVAEIEILLPSLADDSIEELYRFGSLMVSGSQQRALRLDSKLTGILNWSSAVLAFVLIDANVSHLHGIALAVSVVVMLIALASVAYSYLGLKSRLWQMPSEGDWFQRKALEKPGVLRRYHIVSMLNMHQSQSEGNERRASMLKWAERCLAGSAAVIFGMLLSRLL
jgi:hypothetical protein